MRTTVTKLEQQSFHYSEILKPVNGLICFANHGLAAVRILNPSTRELTPWIASSLRQNKKYNFIADLVVYGYQPISLDLIQPPNNTKFYALGGYVDR